MLRRVISFYKMVFNVKRLFLQEERGYFQISEELGDWWQFNP